MNESRQLAEWTAGLRYRDHPIDVSAAEVREKFHSLVDPILPSGRPQAIVDLIERIETERDVSNLVGLLVVPEEARRLQAG